MARHICLTVTGTILVLFGAAVLVLSLYVSPMKLPTFFNEQVDKYVVVDSDVSNVSPQLRSTHIYTEIRSIQRLGRAKRYRQPILLCMKRI